MKAIGRHHENDPPPIDGQSRMLQISKARLQIARVIAKYFILHLEAELKKPEEVLTEDYPGEPVRMMTIDQIHQVRHVFGICESEALPAQNLFERWCEINGEFDYCDSAVIGYNRMFLPRLLDLRNGTDESREALFCAMKKTFDAFDYDAHGFTVAFFLDSEGTMRELLRETLRRELPDLEPIADKIILDQSRAFHRAMYGYFEGVLKASLAENVRLLHGILPPTIANELKRNGVVEPVYFEESAVIFTDFVDFAQTTTALPPGEVIKRLDRYFVEFDCISRAHHLEKIKTIGDSYMAVAGVPVGQKNPALAACLAALEMMEASKQISGPNGWQIRIGVHVGPLIAGVIGRHKFSYDVWGATVNFASRMQSSSEPGRINVSAAVHSRVGPLFNWQARGFQPVKKMDLTEMYFLIGRKSKSERGQALHELQVESKS
jgi:class 3 adenylate cyclase